MLPNSLTVACLAPDVDKCIRADQLHLPPNSSWQGLFLPVFLNSTIHGGPAKFVTIAECFTSPLLALMAANILRQNSLLFKYVP